MKAGRFGLPNFETPCKKCALFVNPGVAVAGFRFDNVSERLGDKG